MYFKIYPEKNSTINEKYPLYNTGLDSILELSKENLNNLLSYRGTWTPFNYYNIYDQVEWSGSLYNAVQSSISELPISNPTYWTLNTASQSYNSRIVIKFDLNKISSSIINSASYSYLNLYCADIQGMSSEYSIYVHPLSQDWVRGTGKLISNKKTDGVTWKYRSKSNEWSTQGSSYYSNISASQNFSHNNYDIHMDVSNIISLWNSGSINNYGFLIKKSIIDEQNNENLEKISFYSLNTNTIYLPELEFKYDDHIYDTSSFYPYNLSGSVSASLLSNSDIDITIKNLKRTYKYETTNRFYLNIKKQYQTKTFYENITHEPMYFIEDQLYYSIVDAYADREIIPFSDYSRISLSNIGYYFDIPLYAGFMPNRFYKISFKCIINNVDVIIDKNYTFKVIE